MLIKANNIVIHDKTIASRSRGTPRGRSVTPAAYEHLRIPFVENKKTNNEDQETIF